MRRRRLRASVDEAALSWDQDTRQTTLPNGLRVVTQYCPGPFTSISFSVNVGGYDEEVGQLGIAHLTEHLVFKGTERRTCREVNESLARYGGDLNAQTEYESTQYFCTVLNEYLEEGVDVLSDLVFAHTVPPEEFAREKSVVIEELRMYGDQGDERVYSLANRSVYAGYPSMHDLGGTPDSVAEITRDDVLAFTEEWYAPDNVVVAVVSGDPGAHERVVEAVNRYCGHLAPSGVNHPRLSIDARDFVVSDVEESMPGEQSHLLLTLPLVYPAPSLCRSTVYELLSTATGGWMGSRVKKVREEYGYCYVINMSYGASSVDERFTVYAGLNAENLEDATRLVFDEFVEAADYGFTEDEFNVAVNTVRCSLLHQASTTESACFFLTSALRLGMPLEVDAYLRALDVVSLGELNLAARELLVPDNWAKAVVRQVEV